ncbi:MAG: HEAT repeat domain-containing protein [Candidatus Omnitrophica bacterium]|nr:HEAT repeat domain-containing protein [Candidatus Omnitrophota bacterium]
MLFSYIFIPLFECSWAHIKHNFSVIWSGDKSPLLMVRENGNIANSARSQLSQVIPEDIFAPIETLRDNVISAVKRGDNSCLELPLHLRFAHYQEYIKQVTARNLAILECLKDESFCRSHPEFLRQAIRMRIQLMDNRKLTVSRGGYLASLSETGRNTILEAGRISSSGKTNDAFKAIKQLMQPSSEWFIHLNSADRLKTFHSQSIILLFPCLGCSGQCDHCFLNAPFCIHCMPWPWIEQAVSSIPGIMPSWISADYFRDYCDLVFMKYPVDILKGFNQEIKGIIPGISSIGLRPNSVAAWSLLAHIDRCAEIRKSLNAQWSILESTLEYRLIYSLLGEKGLERFFGNNIFLFDRFSRVTTHARYYCNRKEEPLCSFSKFARLFHRKIYDSGICPVFGRIRQLSESGIDFNIEIKASDWSPHITKSTFLMPDGALAQVDFETNNGQPNFRNLLPPMPGATHKNGVVLCRNCNINCQFRQKYMRQLGLTNTGGLQSSTFAFCGILMLPHEPIWLLVLIFAAVIFLPRLFADPIVKLRKSYVKAFKKEKLITSLVSMWDSIRNKVAQIVGSQCQNKNLLSIGVGTGDLEQKLIKRYGVKITGIDITPEFLQHAKKIGVSVALADAHKLPFGGNTFDAVLLCESIGHMDFEKVLSECFRVLKPKGVVHITTYTPQVNVRFGYRACYCDDLLEVMRKVGFRKLGMFTNFVESPYYYYVRGLKDRKSVNLSCYGVFLAALPVLASSLLPTSSLNILSFELFYIILIAPVIEEIVFRKLLYKQILRRFSGVAVSVFISSVLFSLAHYVFETDLGLLNLARLYAYGVIFAVAYEKTKRLWVPILIHAINNSIVYLYPSEAIFNLHTIFIAVVLILVFAGRKRFIAIFDRQSKVDSILVELYKEFDDLVVIGLKRVFSYFKKIILPVLFAFSLLFLGGCNDILYNTPYDSSLKVIEIVFVLAYFSMFSFADSVDQPEQQHNKTEFLLGMLVSGNPVAQRNARDIIVKFDTTGEIDKAVEILLEVISGDTDDFPQDLSPKQIKEIQDYATDILGSLYLCPNRNIEDGFRDREIQAAKKIRVKELEIKFENCKSRWFYWWPQELITELKRLLNETETLLGAEGDLPKKIDAFIDEMQKRRIHSGRAYSHLVPTITKFPRAYKWAFYEVMNRLNDELPEMNSPLWNWLFAKKFLLESRVEKVEFMDKKAVDQRLAAIEILIPYVIAQWEVHNRLLNRGLSLQERDWLTAKDKLLTEYWKSVSEKAYSGEITTREEVERCLEWVESLVPEEAEKIAQGKSLRREENILYSWGMLLAALPFIATEPFLFDDLKIPVLSNLTEFITAHAPPLIALILLFFAVRYLWRFVKREYGFSFRKALLMLLVGVTLFSSGCMSWEMKRIDRQIAKRWIENADEELEKRDFVGALQSIRLAAERDINSLNKMRSLTQEEKTKFVDLHLEYYSGIDIEVFQDAPIILAKLGITSEEMHDGYLRLLGKHRFAKGYYRHLTWGFSAARALAAFGDASGKDILIEYLQPIERLRMYDVISSANPLNYPSDSLLAQIPEEEKNEFLSAIRESLYFQAVFSLAQLEEPEAVEHLIKITKDDNSKYNADVRAYATICLSNYHEAEVLDALMDLALDMKEEVRAAAISGLGNFSEAKVFDRLAGALEDKKARVVNEAITALGNLGDSRAVDYLENVFKEKRDKETRIRVMYSLTQLDNDERLPIFIREARNSIPEVRRLALIGLADYDTQQANEIKFNSLNDSDASVRAAGIGLLAPRIDSDNNVREAVTKLLEKEWNIKAKLLYLNNLNGVQDAGIRSIIADGFNHRDWRLRLGAINYFSQFQDKDATSQIAGMLEDKKLEVQQAAIFACAERLENNPQLFDVLHGKLLGPLPVISNSAAICLAPHVDRFPQLEAPLSKFLRESDINTSRQILAGLGQAKGSQAARILGPYAFGENLVINNVDVCKTNPLLRQEAILSYAQIGRPEFSKVIPSLATESDWRVRWAAAATLKMFGDKPQVLPAVKVLVADSHPLVRQEAVLSSLQIPAMPVSDLATHLQSPSWQNRLVTAQALGPRIGSDKGLAKTFVAMARTDVNPLVRAQATSDLWRINSQEAMSVMKQNFASNNLQLRYSAAQSLGRLNLPSASQILLTGINDPNPLVRSAVISGLGNRITQFPQAVPQIQPTVHKDFWKSVETFNKAPGKTNYPNFDKLVLPALRDPSVSVRQAAITNLGLLVHNTPKLVDPLITVLKHDSDPWNRQLAAFSLNTVKAPQIDSVRHTIRQMAPEVRVVVITPGINSFNIRAPGRSLTQDCTKDWTLRRILELGGVKVIEHRWEGYMRDMPRVQKEFDSTELKALKLAGDRGLVLNIGHSAGNIVHERLSVHLLPGGNSQISQAIREQRIKIISLNSPSMFDFSKVDRNWKNVSSITDPISWPSLVSNMSSKYVPLGPILKYVFPVYLPYPNKHNIQYPYFSSFHEAHVEVREIANYYRQARPNLYMPNLEKMIQHQDVSTWRYLPGRGYWPGVYNFSSTTPSGQQFFYKPLNFVNNAYVPLVQYKYQSPILNEKNQLIYQPQPLPMLMPQKPVMLQNNFYQPSNNFPKYSPPPQLQNQNNWNGGK